MAETMRDEAPDAIAIHADTMGHDFVAALLAELRQMPDHWARLSEEKQQQIIERLKEKVRTAVTKAQSMILRANLAAVPADLESVGFKNGITAALKIPRDALHRHELADAQGQRVLVIIADGNRWLERMDEIKAKAAQADMFDADDANYDPSKDQPSYRRDQDRVAPAGPTWEDLKKSLKSEPAPPDAEQKPSIDETNAAPGETPASSSEIVFGSAASDKEEATAAYRILQEQLASIGCQVSLGAVQAYSPAQLEATRTWVAAYAAEPDACRIARPLWLPIPERDEGEDKNTD